MPSIVEALAPAFAAGFGIQQLVEMTDRLVTWAARRVGWRKKSVAMALSAALGLTVSIAMDLRIMATLAAAQKDTAAVISHAWSPDNIVDVLVTALTIGAGTEGFNSILKLLGYKKDETKETAANAQQGVDRATVPNASATDLVLPAPQVVP